MTNERYVDIIRTTKQQEEMLRFDHFSNLDAWNLGSFLVERVHEKQIDMAISIRKLNGSIIFQHLTENTSLNNQKWMQRKFNTVCLTEGSSLRAWAVAALKGQTFEEQGISLMDYAFCGGGFPIRLKSGELVAVLIVSNLPHKQDHGFIVDSLALWLDVTGVPAVE